jgi:hypothetical protein
LEKLALVIPFQRQRSITGASESGCFRFVGRAEVAFAIVGVDYRLFIEPATWHVIDAFTAVEGHIALDGQFTPGRVGNTTARATAIYS